MRVTLNMLFGNATRYINNNQQTYLTLEEQLLSTRRINRPSDDPVGASRAIELRKTLATLDQFDRNLSQAQSFTDQTDVALINVSDRLQRAIELTTDINGGTSGPSEYAAAAEELDNILTEVIANANAKIGTRYIFAGYESTTRPFDDLGNYTGGASGQEIQVEVAQGEYMTINLTGDDAFKSPVDVMQMLADTRDAVASGDQAAISAQLPLLDDALDHILAVAADNGARSNRVSIAQEDNVALKESYNNILSGTEDLDLTEASARFAEQERLLEITMAVSGKLLSQNFLDFLD